MNIILLSGGSGTRLWPLSNEVRSKQFLKIFRKNNGEHESMLQRVYRMIKEIDNNANIVIATSANQIASIKKQLPDNVHISIEPCRRDTFPAIALSTAYMHDILGVGLDDSIAVCPVDPLVDIDYFEAIKKMYENTDKSNIVLMGIKPTYPSEKYGYIVQKDNGVLFKEKPDVKRAQEYIDQGALWNGGVFAFKTKYVLEKARELCGSSLYRTLLNNYESFEKISFDYAVVEKENNIKVIVFSGEWKDLGTWNTFTEAMTDAIGGNAVLGEGCENVHVVNELSIPIVGLGLKDVVIAATPDGILVSDKHASSYLKKYVPDNRPMYEKRIWGEYRVLDYHAYDDGSNSLTKELVVFANESISYQRHAHRNEIWTFVSGTGLLVVDGVVRNIKSGDFVYINKGQYHAVKAFDEIHIIEVQIGDELVEEDIERVDFDWNSIKL